MNHGYRSSVTLAAVTLVWIGLLLGVSFLATPVKFLAPSLTLPVALDVGRQTFSLFNKVEIVLALSMLVLVLIQRRGWRIFCACGLAALVALQSLWLLPALDRRLGTILGGGTPPPSHLHNIYIAFDATKLLLLTAIAALAFRELVKRP